MQPSNTQPSTLVQDAIPRPDEPRHFMVIERVRGVAVARVGTTEVARSERALRVREVGRHVYDPVIYFPPGDVRGELLDPVDKTTACPLKGTASYFDVAGDVVATEGAWSYQKTHDFDRRVAQLECCVAFDRTAATIEVSTADGKGQER